MERLTKKDFVGMPWKNGGGVTTELFKISSTFDSSFLFRLSIANVDSSGSFSHFTNTERILLLLEGAGFHLKSSEYDFSLTDSQTPFYFSGESSIYCTLLNGPCRDFNVMTEKNFAKSHLSIVDINPNEVISFKAECDLKFIYDKNEMLLYKLNRDEQHTMKVSEIKKLIIVDVTLL